MNPSDPSLNHTRTEPKRWGRRLALACLGTALTVCAFLAWCVLTTPGLAWVSTRLVHASDGRLVLDRPSGTLWRGPSFAQLIWRDPGTPETGGIEVHAMSVGAIWHWHLGLQPRLTMDHIKADRLSVKTTSGSAPSRLPASLYAPVPIEVKALELPHLEWNAVSLDGVSLRGQIAGPGGVHIVDALAARYQSVDLSLAGQMQAQSPFETHAVLRAEGTQPVETRTAVTKTIAWQTHAQLNGPLARVRLQLQGRSESPVQTVTVDAVLTPFEAWFFQQIDASAQAFNPRQWIHTWPSAQLNAQVRVLPGNAQSDTLDVQAQVSNSAPQPLDAGGVPIRLLKARGTVLLPAQTSAPMTVYLPELRLDLGAGAAPGGSGHMEGDLRSDSDGIQSHIRLLGVNPKAVHSAAFSSAVDGQLALKGTGGTHGPWQLQGQLTDKLRRLNVDLAYQSAVLQIQNLLLNDSQGSVLAQGSLGLNAHSALKLNVSAKKFDPALYTSAATGRLDFDMRVDARLAPQPEGRLELDLHESRWQGEPVQGALTVQGLADAHAPRIDAIRADIAVSGNRFKVQGAYGAPGQALSWNIQAPKLDVLNVLFGVPVKGRLSGSANTLGVWPQVSGTIQLQAQALEWEKALSVKALSADLALGVQPTAPWVGRVQLQGLASNPGADAWLQSAEAQLKGTRAQHELQLSMDTGRRVFNKSSATYTTPLKGALTLKGGMKGEGLEWAGMLQSATVMGLYRQIETLNLTQPAPLNIRADGVDLNTAVFKGTRAGVLNLVRLSYGAGRIETKGALEKWLLPRIGSITGDQLGLEPRDLAVQVDWDWLSTPQALKASVDMRSVAGDLEIREDGEAPAGLKNLTASLRLSDRMARFDAQLDADRVGKAQAQLNVPLAPAAGGFWKVDTQNALAGFVRGDFANLVWLGPSIDPDFRTEGRGQVDVALYGTPGQPKAKGTLKAQALELALIDEGARLSNGEVQIDFDETQARFTKGQFVVYGRQAPRDRINELGPLIVNTGYLDLNGAWRLSGGGGEVTATLKNLALLQRADRWLMLTGQLRVAQPAQPTDPIVVTGRLDADGAYIEQPRNTVDTLDDDVEILGRTTSTNGAERQRIKMDVMAHLGDRFFFSGSGLTSRLVGGVRLALEDRPVVQNGLEKEAPARRVRATGSIRTEGGSYTAYGQNLTIERGILNFQGDPGNPGLNVRAVRKGLAVEAGVEVSGFARRPRVKLVSDPAVPDSEKLSWLVLGQGSDRLNAKDSSFLIGAATALLGNNGETGLTKQIAQAFGLDDIGFSSGNLTGVDPRALSSRVATSPASSGNTATSQSADPQFNQRILSVTKRVGKDVYLAYEQSLTTAANIVKLTYQLTRQVSLIGRTGADNAVDLLYQLSFD